MIILEESNTHRVTAVGVDGRVKISILRQRMDGGRQEELLLLDGHQIRQLEDERLESSSYSWPSPLEPSAIRICNHCGAICSHLDEICFDCKRPFVAAHIIVDSKVQYIICAHCGQHCPSEQDRCDNCGRQLHSMYKAS